MDTKTNTKITVLGKTFNSEEERRTYFREELRKKLPELKKMEGFPIGEDEDILKLSDPPYYTACPNPWLNDFIEEWEEEKIELEKQGKRTENFEIEEPYAADVSEGKNNPIYMAHSYHTKVPHPAIMRYILHYTQPGDIIYDGFAGTGMTGVAASMCENPDREFKCNIENLFSNIKWGKRNSICSDLSPYASFIANGYNSVVDSEEFLDKCLSAISSLEEKYDWLYSTQVNNVTAKINYVLWSEILKCKSCGNQQPSWDPNDFDYFQFEKDTQCLNCGSIGKDNFSIVMETYFDEISNIAATKKKYSPVVINYIINGKRGFKKPDLKDLEIIDEVSKIIKEFKTKIAAIAIEKGDKTNELLRDNWSYIHRLFTPRNLIILIELWESLDFERGRMLVTSTLTKTSSILHNVGFKKGKINLAGALPNALYVPGIFAERNLFELHRSKLKDLSFKGVSTRGIVQTSSATNLSTVNNNSIDYIFTDPPFGANLMYSELNSIHEGWLKVKTATKDEAIINRSQNKKQSQYLELMQNSFLEYYRILKPDGWMTVEFSSTKAEIWNIIQTALVRSNFIVASVDALNKGQGTYNSQTNPTSVKQDLIISCYKPSSEFDKKFQQHQSSELAVWDFVEEHLNHLPIHLVLGNSTTAIIERSPKILFDRLIAFYVQRGLPVPIDAGKFQQGLRERFIERDGMFFTNEQVQEYDKKKKDNPEFIQLSLLVSSEQDGVLWLKNFLVDKALTYQDIQPHWMQALAGVRKGDLIPELATILEENFLKDEAGKWYAPDPENEADLEKLRKGRLSRLFEGYKKEIENPRTKIKEVRVEALREGFKQCYQDKDFKTIIAVGDRIPNNLLMEDEVLLQFYDIASSRV
ncbi:DNA methyltransferase [Aequorivita nionensis]|uniref:DNA methyltransferase n=1 Tax=Aequorivita nionensis TaxID=1287690 RepID=UPI0039659BA6